MINPVQWFEIAATQIERAKVFYKEVFGLQFEYIEMPDTKMYMFGMPGHVGTPGCLVQSSSSKPSTEGTIVYFTCEDVNQEVARVEKAGGQIIVPKTDIGEFGFFAQAIDTEGNRIGLHSNK